MEPVGAGLGNEADLCAGGASGIGVGETSGDTKLLNRILGLTKDASEGEAVDLVVVVDTIHGDVALIGAAAIDSATAAVLHRGIAGWGQINDARLEREDIRHVTGLAGKRLDSRVVRRVSQRRVGDV